MLAYLYTVDTCRTCAIEIELSGEFRDLKKQALNDFLEVVREMLDDGMNMLEVAEAYSTISADNEDDCFFLYGADDGCTVVTTKKINNDEEMSEYLDYLFDTYNS